MSVATGIALAVAGTTAAVSASQKAKAAKSAAAGQAVASADQLKYYRQQASDYQAAISKFIKDGEFEFPEVDAGAASDQALAVTTRNLPGVVANTRTAFDAAAENFKRYLTAAVGKDSAGEDALPKQQVAVNDIVLDQLKGRVAEGTRTLLGRQALATGAVNLGRGAVQDAWTYKLGLAAEEQVQRGIESFGNIYQMYGRFAPQISPLDLLPYGGLNTGQSLANAQFNAEGQWRAQMAQVQAILGGITQETATVGPAVGPAAFGPFGVRAAGLEGSAGVTEAIGSAIGGLFSAYGAQQAIQRYGSIYGAAATPLSAVESAFNRANGIEDVTSYYRGTGADSLFRGGAFGQSGAFGGANASNSILSLLSQMRKLNSPN